MGNRPFGGMAGDGGRVRVVTPLVVRASTLLHFKHLSWHRWDFTEALAGL